MASVSPSPRRQNFMTLSWFWDQYTRKVLDLDPPYQRRSVWNQEFRDYFIDTLLLGYPAPAIFLYEEISSDGLTKYHVVDGKQRLSTIFDFVNNKFPVADTVAKSSQRGKFFRDLDDTTKRAFWSYQFSVEYLPSDDESIIKDVFDRINRNTARLTPQELRHAKFDGAFIQSADRLAEYISNELGPGFPNIAARSRNQMKDVEFVAQLLLLLEKGARGYSLIELDEAFADRDSEWDVQSQIEARFRRTLATIKRLTAGKVGKEIRKSRFRNQADFYALFGAVSRLPAPKSGSRIERWQRRLIEFVETLDDERVRDKSKLSSAYFEAARSASNDTGPRRTRIRTLLRVMRGRPTPSGK